MDISLAWCHGCLYCLIPKIMWDFVNIDLTSNNIVYLKIIYITVNYLFIKLLLLDGNFLNQQYQT